MKFMVRRNRLLYFAVNIVFVIGALFFLDYKVLFTVNYGMPTIIWIFLLFLCIHLMRFARMYFILLEDLIKPSRFLQLYVKTTFVSSLIPFKIGEFFKMYCYGVETGSTMKGVIAVLIEKTFDAFVLCLFMVPYALSNGIINLFIFILASFMVIILVFYLTFDGTYKYLNKFLICRGGGKKSLTILKILEAVNEAYLEAKRILRGRLVLLLFLSLLAWMAEGVLIAVMNADFDFGVVVSYISDGFLGISNFSFNYYTCLCAVVFLILMGIIYGRKYFIIIRDYLRRRYEKNHCSI